MSLDVLKCEGNEFYRANAMKAKEQRMSLITRNLGHGLALSGSDSPPSQSFGSLKEYFQLLFIPQASPT